MDISVIMLFAINIIGFLISVSMLITGIILLVRSVKKTINRDKHIGGIVAGGLLTLLGTIGSTYMCIAFLTAGFVVSIMAHQ